MKGEGGGKITFQKRRENYRVKMLHACVRARKILKKATFFFLKKGEKCSAEMQRKSICLCEEIAGRAKGEELYRKILR